MLARSVTALLVLIAATLGGGYAPAHSSAQTDAPGRGSHTVLIVLENREFSEVVGSQEAPYFNALIRHGALATHSYGLRHPSLPNYLALIGGSTFGVTDNCTDCRASGPNLATQLSAAGISWRAYMGGMPEPCYAGAAVGAYVKRHNPFMYFPSLASQPGLCGRVVSETALNRDLAGRRLPEFAWISPGLCDDGHDCSTAAADAYLRQRIPGILAQLRPRGVLGITYDEGTTAAGCCGDAVGGHIATLLLGSEVKRAVRLPHPYTPYSVLATLEDRFGLPRLRHARGAVTMTTAFRGEGKVRR